MKYFKKNWSAPLQKEVKTMAEKIVSHIFNYLFPSKRFESDLIIHVQFKERYEYVNSIANIAADPLLKLTEDSDWDMSDEGEGDTDKPWLAEFNRYLNTHDVLPEGMTIVEWWGVCNVFFLLACTNSFF